MLKWIGAGFLIYLGIRVWRRAGLPQESYVLEAQKLYLRDFMIAAINPKSVAGYLAAFTQFVQPGTPVSTQIWVIMPTSLGLTNQSYIRYFALGTSLVHSALSAMFNIYLKLILAVFLLAYGLLLGLFHFSNGK